MIGIFLIIAASFFEEISVSSGKESISRHVESIATRVVLSGVWTILFCGLSLILGAEWRFSLASLPFFASRVLLETLLAHITVSAFAQADRSSFGFIRTLTIPLVLSIDLVLGTPLLISQIVGVLALFLAVAVLGFHKSLSTQGVGLAFLSAVIAAVTASLYKYDIGHFNSIVAEQFAATLLVCSYFFIYATVNNEHPLLLLKKPRIFGESSASGAGNILASFAYGFAPASVIMAGHRAASVCLSVVAGALHFHERHIGEKFLVLGLTVIGIVLLVR